MPASDLCAHLSAPAQRSQLAAVALDQLHALVAPSAEQLQLYLDNPPAGGCEASSRRKRWWGGRRKWGFVFFVCFALLVVKRR